MFSENLRRFDLSARGDFAWWYRTVSPTVITETGTIDATIAVET